MPTRIDYGVVLSQNISQGQSILKRLLCCFYRGSAYQTSFVCLSIKILDPQLKTPFIINLFILLRNAIASNVCIEYLIFEMNVE